MIRFKQLDHSYTSLDPSKQVDWIGVTSVCDAFKPSFDPVAGSIKASRNPRSKWRGMDPAHIRDIWKGESKRSLNMGTWYHNKEESTLLNKKDLILEGTNMTVYAPMYIEDDKLASNQVLANNSLYPEHLVYLQSHGICGQVDRLEVINHKVNIKDYKTFKVLKTEGFTNWEGISERMLDPISHLDNCNFVSAALQLSMYLYMILKHNPQFLPGKLMLEHIIFEQESEDQYGYPIYKRGDNNQFIIKEIKPYPVTYLKSEVISILNYLSGNRELVKSRIETNRNR